MIYYWCTCVISYLNQINIVHCWHTFRGKLVLLLKTTKTIISHNYSYVKGDLKKEYKNRNNMSSWVIYVLKFGPRYFILKVSTGSLGLQQPLYAAAALALSWAAFASLSNRGGGRPSRRWRRCCSDRAGLRIHSFISSTHQGGKGKLIMAFTSAHSGGCLASWLTAVLLITY